MSKLLEVKESKNKPKRFYALFKKENELKSVGFGDPEGSTYIDHKDKTKRSNYIKRHSNNPLEKKFLNKKKYYDAPANLSMHILWGASTNIKENIKDYKKKYNL